MNSIQIYTDGACRGNPGPGAYAYVVLLSPAPVQYAEAVESTTNNRMELTAAIKALECAQQKVVPQTELVLLSDSNYLIQGVTSWLANWKRNGWKTSAKKNVKNRDLWQELDRLTASLPITWQWVKGHAENEYNNLCDQLANDAIDQIS